MSVKIKRVNEKYFLESSNEGIILKIDCKERILLFNKKYLKINKCEKQLYNDFSTAIRTKCQKKLEDALNNLIRLYGLQRNLPFEVNNFANILLSNISTIKKDYPINSKKIMTVPNPFERINSILSKRLNRKNNLLPEVTLSKILHFCNPKSFWIIDSKIKALLRLLGYTNNYLGYGEMLKDLFNSSEFEEFKKKILEIDDGQHKRKILKILDIVLWL